MHHIMTAEDIAKSYVWPGPKPPKGRSQFAFWMIFVVVQLALFVAGGAACARLSSMPWWIPVSAAILGLIVGLWLICSDFPLLDWKKSNFRSLVVLVFFVCWKGFSDFLASCVVPYEQHHSSFALALLAFFFFGVLAAVLPKLVHGILNEER